jgi:hypothetical protein
MGRYWANAFASKFTLIPLPTNSRMPCVTFSNQLCDAISWTFIDRQSDAKRGFTDQ